MGFYHVQYRYGGQTMIGVENVLLYKFSMKMFVCFTG